MPYLYTPACIASCISIVFKQTVLICACFILLWIPKLVPLYVFHHMPIQLQTNGTHGVLSKVLTFSSSHAPVSLHAFNTCHDQYNIHVSYSPCCESPSAVVRIQSCANILMYHASLPVSLHAFWLMPYLYSPACIASCINIVFKQTVLICACFYLVVNPQVSSAVCIPSHAITIAFHSRRIVRMAFYQRYSHSHLLMHQYHFMHLTHAITSTHCIQDGQFMCIILTLL